MTVGRRGVSAALSFARRNVAGLFQKIVPSSINVAFLLR